ncbi:MAG: hypothetical protein V7604_771 [Hyphomicrobiales bacterium]|jgi:hypothetical protein
MTIKILLAAVAALSLAGIDGANAATKHKRHHKVMVHQPAGLTAPLAPYFTRTPGPPWAGPGECYTDEGYGRYWPCGAGRGHD